MCNAALYQPPSPPVSDSEVTPDGSEPLLIRKMRPQAPHGYVARFVDGQWRIVPDPQFYGTAQAGGLPGFGLGTESGGSHYGSGDGGVRGAGQGSG